MKSAGLSLVLAVFSVFLASSQAKAFNCIEIGDGSDFEQIHIPVTASVPVCVRAVRNTSRTKLIWDVTDRRQYQISARQRGRFLRSFPVRNGAGSLIVPQRYYAPVEYIIVPRNARFAYQVNAFRHAEPRKRQVTIFLSLTELRGRYKPPPYTNPAGTPQAPSGGPAQVGTGPGAGSVDHLRRMLR